MKECDVFEQVQFETSNALFPFVEGHFRLKGRVCMAKELSSKVINNILVSSKKYILFFLTFFFVYCFDYK